MYITDRLNQSHVECAECGDFIDECNICLGNDFKGKRSLLCRRCEHINNLLIRKSENDYHERMFKKTVEEEARKLQFVKKRNMVDNKSKITKETTNATE